MMRIDDDYNDFDSLKNGANNVKFGKFRSKKKILLTT